MSGYLVLAQEGGTWIELGVTDANSAEQAVRRASENHDVYSVFLAVPERSWKPLKVERVETVQVKIGEAKAKPVAVPDEPEPAKDVA